MVDLPFAVRNIALAMCDVISGNFTRSTNDIDCLSRPYGTRVIMYAPSHRIIFHFLVDIFFNQGSGVIFVLNLPRFGFSTVYLLPIICTTVMINFVSATLITLRILYFERYIRKTVGVQRSDSPYMTILIICVESSALIIVFSLIYVILFFQQNNGSWVPLQVLVHIYVSIRNFLDLSVQSETRNSFKTYIGFISTSHRISGRPGKSRNRHAETFGKKARCIIIAL
jgi:hypothetical protein